LGLKSDGSIVTWGDNAYGQCTLPTPNSEFVAVTAGDFHSLGLKMDGSIVAWGSNVDEYGNYVGQCTVPSPNTGFVAIGAGRYESLGIRGTASVTDVSVAGAHRCASGLSATFPNPFNPITTIEYEVSAPVQVRLQVFDLRGRLVRTLVDQRLGAGHHRVQWTGADDRGQELASGVYIYRLEAGTFRQTRRMTLAR